jgi:hypothetical protein
VLLAACRDIEEAKEYSGDGEHRGSVFLLFAGYLAENQRQFDLSRTCLKRASALVQSRVSAQAPQLEASVSEDLDKTFLGGAIQPRTPHFTVSHHRDHGWIIDGGTIHGIAQPVRGETTRLALFPFDAADEALHQGNPVGTAVVTAVMPGISQVQIEGIDPLDTDMTFKAVITALPLPPMGVLLSGEAAAIAQLQQALDNANGDGQPSLYVRAVEATTDAKFQVLAEDGEYRIKRPADDRILVAPLKSDGPGQARQLVSQLENLARWTTFLELESSPTSRIKASDVTMEISHSGTME